MNKPGKERPVFRCHFCDFHAESKYARKSHEQACKHNPSRARSIDRASEPPAAPYVPFWDRQPHLRAEHRSGRLQGFTEPFVRTSYRVILLNGERDL